MTARTFDIVLFGATGFTGRLVAEYLATAAPAGTRIALAGRNPGKLEEIRKGLPPAAAAWPLIEADSGDAPSLQRMAEQARVVCTTVGPYAKYGLPLVKACAEAGTHYCDLTGEPQFMRDSIDQYDEVAKASGARIVHTCGVDSIPSDLGMLALFNALGPMRRATFVVQVFRGGASGGTVASLLHGLDEAKNDRRRRKQLTDPYALSPDRAAEPVLGDERDLATVKYDHFVGQWTAPFIMASVNTRVVRRSNALLGYAWGKALRYAEVSGMKKGLRGFLRSLSQTAVMGAGMAGLMFPATRKLLEARLPKPGEGPDEETRKNGFVRVRIFGESEKGERKTLLIEGQGDPGYRFTSLLLGQAALCLALDEAKLPARAGVLTPSTAMGKALLDRLLAAGVVFKIEEAAPQSSAA